LGKSGERGKEGEEIAFRLLKKKGYRIIARNYVSSWGEIDLIALEPESRTLVFVEVKLRKNSYLAHPLEAIDGRKVERIKKTALTFLQKVSVEYENIRFDVVAIVGKRAVHVVNAF